MCCLYPSTPRWASSPRRAATRDGTLSPEHSTAVGTNVHLPRVVCTPSQDAGRDSAEPLRALDVGPVGSLVSCSVELLARGPVTEGVHVPRRARTETHGDLLRVLDGAAAHRLEAGAEVGRDEDASVGADVYGAGFGRVRGDVSDGGCAADGAPLGEGAAGVRADVEGAAGTAVEVRVVTLVAGDDGRGS